MSDSQYLTAANGSSVFGNKEKGLIGHINVASMNPKNSKFIELQDILIKSNLDVIGISETWLTEYINSEAVALDNYAFVRCNRVNRRSWTLYF